MRLLPVILLTILSLVSKGQIANRFQVGESLTYDVYYSLMGVWVGAGDVTFSVLQDSIYGKPCYHFKGFGKTYPRYDWFYKVRDTYEAYSDQQTLKPFRFRRDVSEGNFFMTEENIYNHKSQEIIVLLKEKDDPIIKDTIPYEEGSFDVLSLIYHARSLDFEHYEEGQKIPIKMVIDKETYDLYIRYLGIDVYDHSKFGEIECYVFSPLLVEGTIFKSGEKMKVWVTRDENVIPVYVQSEIRVGSIRSEIRNYKGLKTGEIEAFVKD